MPTHFETWKAQHASLWQFIMFMLMSLVTTVVDLGTFALFNFWIFASFQGEPFAWWIISYSVDDGGLCAFLAFACSFAMSQTFNFFLQRKTTFKANNNVLYSGILYAVMVVVVYFLQLLLPSLIMAPIAAVLGAGLASILVKFVNMSTSMLIQYPMNKYVIMKNVSRS